jgi:hypothetical protein
MYKFTICFLLCLSTWSMAAEKVPYQQWVVEVNGMNTEAYTVNDSKDSFGLFCSGTQCLFYLHQNFQCQPGGTYAVLMNSASVSGALKMQCTQVGGNLFSILDPFNQVLGAIKSGDTIGFAVALQSGAFSVARFSLAGAPEAVQKTLIDAAQSRQRTSPIMPTPITPPAGNGIKDITI